MTARKVIRRICSVDNCDRRGVRDVQRMLWIRNCTVEAIFSSSRLCLTFLKFYQTNLEITLGRCLSLWIPKSSKLVEHNPGSHHVFTLLCRLIAIFIPVVMKDFWVLFIPYMGDANHHIRICRYFLLGWQTGCDSNARITRLDHPLGHFVFIYILSAVMLVQFSCYFEWLRVWTIFLDIIIPKLTVLYSCYCFLHLLSAFASLWVLFLQLNA